MLDYGAVKSFNNFIFSIFNVDYYDVAVPQEDFLFPSPICICMCMCLVAVI